MINYKRGIDMKKNKKGFTIVELIVVISIISILMLIGVPAYGSIMERVKVRADKASAVGIGQAVVIRELDAGEDNKISSYPSVTRYDKISNISVYTSKGYKPKSMEDGYYFATAFETDKVEKFCLE